ncbi:MAG: hypothetical protein SGJ19_22875 [Planctomycetia bacterium]|nr:hypothetical protein [Planctomycetia bacterium]
MPKFVVIDPSLRDYQGHYFEYAARVLRAAEDRGFEPVLIANRQLHASPADFRTHAAYRYGFFYASGKAAATATGAGERISILSAIFWARFQLRYSRFGLWCALHSPWSWGLERGAWRDRAESGHWFRLIVLFVVLEARALAELAVCWLPYRESIDRLAAALVCYLRRAAKDVVRHFKAAMAVAKTQLGKSGPLREHLWRRLKLRHFVRDTCDWLDAEPVLDGDMVLLSVTSAVELMALTRVWRRRPESLLATWHLVFRHNLHARDAQDASGEALRPLRNAFQWARVCVPLDKVFLYADTEELTSQYNSLSSLPFRTLPVPVGGDYLAARHVNGTQKTLQITYVGDARFEKGYHLLPRLVGDLWERWIAPRAARFVIQSNFSSGDVAPEVAIARAQLGGYAADKVRLLTEPLAPVAYRDLVRDADVLLLPYDGAQYFARSSGILAEALTAGVPVVAPAGTWMAMQLTQPHYAYHQSLRETSQVLETRTLDNSHWKLTGIQGSRPVIDGRLQLGGRRQCECRLKSARGASELLITFQQETAQRGQFVELQVAQYASSGRLLASSTHVLGGCTSSVSLLVHLKQRVRFVQLLACNAYTSLPMELADVRCDFLRAEMRRPLSAVGVVLNSPRELAAATQEILRNHAHYRATAGDFAQVWSRRHNPAALVEMLISATRTTTTTPRVEPPRPHFLASAARPEPGWAVLP